MSSLDSAVAAVLASLTPRGDPASQADMDVVIRLAPRALDEEPSGDRRMQLATALVLAASRQDRPDAAVTRAEAELEVAESNANVTDSTLGDFLAAAAEAHVTIGSLRRSTLLAERALSYARARGDVGRMFRGCSLLAVSRALNGEYAAAADSAADARRLQREGGWPAAAASYPLLLSEILLASALLDGAALVRIVDELRSTHVHDPLWAATATVAEAMACLITGDVVRAVPLLTSVVNGSDQHGVLDMIRGFSLGVYADVLLSQGEARRALTLLEGRPSPTGHVLCFDMQRAAAFLLLADNEAALRVTDGCIALGTEHCLRTVAPVLLRRAVASDRLGQHDIADRRFAEAFQLVVRSGSATPFLTLPTAPLHEMLERYAQHHGDAEAVRSITDRLRAMPPVDEERSAIPRLTERESRLARNLRDPGSLTQIAAHLHVSVNTVKSQARSLYTKLGVNSRQSAVLALRHRGFFD